MIVYHVFSSLVAAEQACARLRAAGHAAYVLSMRADFHEVREIREIRESVGGAA